MQRYHYRAQCRDGIDPEAYFRGALPVLRARMEEYGVRQLSLFRSGVRLFLYYESLTKQADPHVLFSHCEAALEAWPGEDMPRSWVPMTDIFHYQQPVSEEHWRRRDPETKPYARIAKLKPEQAASYIFYHYQYQEEKPGDGDKYGIIALHENLMFFYSEAPASVEPPPYKGKLSTSSTPPDWMSVMEPHFIKWDEETERSLIWLEIPLVIQA
ncbi:hypothetical protein KP806_00665 [Paenibacillus sp. N4]|uniref:hypothetical protein n=1 Tax=Paenibacillus vietnamensis TaxID=2590547 RepID=UPI001CD07A59|nr:hypothetical protein [Paenibacillus vietnamensis]MCA0753546.1 hypothetical protein [Paenibacillus vietnamensis]